MKRLGIIDLGSNSVRLIIIDIDQNNAHHQIENLKETVRLSSNTAPDGSLNDNAVRYAIDTILLFVKFCDARNVDHKIGVATAAVRNAPNGQQVVAQIQAETGLKISILTAEEEAYLGYVGLVNSTPIQDGLMADLGGGSLKLVSFEDRILKRSHTLEFGVLTLTERFDLHDNPTPEKLEVFEGYLEESFASIPFLVNQETVVGLGGTFRSLARIYRQQEAYVPDITDGIEIPVSKVQELYKSVSQIPLAERLKVPGLETARADISIAGFGIVWKLLETVHAKTLNVSTSSIRDGIFFRHILPRDPIVFNVLSHHMNNIINYHRLDENHSRRVSNLAVTLFDQLQPLHQLGSFERRLLLIAATLHEIGQVISIESLEKHSLYMLLNTPFSGLTHRERVLVAYLAASHDEDYLVNLEDFISRGPLQAGDDQILRKLVPLMKITHSLDRSHTGVVTQVRSQISQKICEIDVISKQGAELEIKDARRRAQEFKEVYGCELIIGSNG